MTLTVDAILALVDAARTDAGASVRLQRDGAEAVEVLAAEVRRLRTVIDEASYDPPLHLAAQNLVICLIERKGRWVVRDGYGDQFAAAVRAILAASEKYPTATAVLEGR